jgi:citrate synthase
VNEPDEVQGRPLGDERPAPAGRGSERPDTGRTEARRSQESSGAARESREERALLSAREAAALLGIKPATLYSYVSRGLLESVPGPSARERRYRRDDVERLLARIASGTGSTLGRETRGARAGGGGPLDSAPEGGSEGEGLYDDGSTIEAAVLREAAAPAWDVGSRRAALRWGEPLLESAITEVGPRGPRYRGVAAVDLALEGAGFESVAELLWRGTPPPAPTRWSTDDLGVAPRALASLLPSGAPPLAALAVATAAIGAADLGRFDVRPESVLPRARALIVRLAAALALPGDPDLASRALRAGGVAAALAVALSARSGEGAVLAIERALVLSADHELNASAFTARVVASSGADLYAWVVAALAALSGPRHGGACDRFEALLDEAGSPERAREALRARQRRGEAIPGFFHPLYERGDPRAPPLLAAARELAPEDARLRTVHALVEAALAEGRQGPTLDVGLVAVAVAAGLPRGTAAALFAIGRTAGWVAHGLEQAESGVLLRPRAKYVGP